MIEIDLDSNALIFATNFDPRGTILYRWMNGRFLRPNVEWEDLFAIGQEDRSNLVFLCNSKDVQNHPWLPDYCGMPFDAYGGQVFSVPIDVCIRAEAILMERWKKIAEFH
ncbi:MAG: hypothetical protein WCH39_10295 [Schlesneria sp.]